MQHPEEGLIHAWLDGELSADDAAALEAHFAECRECGASVAEARGLIAASSRIVSALDIVPGDVIPATTPRKRGWYSNTQLRAAAAVLAVAGASLFLMRRDGTPEMGRLMSDAASTPKVDTALPQAPAPAPAASPPAADAAKERDLVAAGRPRGDEEVRANEMSRKIAENAAPPKEAFTATALQGKIAGASATQRDTLLAQVPARSIAEKPQSVMLRSSVPLDEVVVTGVATAATGPAEAAALREVKSDTTGNTAVTIYQVSPGVQVTLVELMPPGFADQRRDARELKKQAATGNAVASAAPAAPAAPPKTARIETITWTNASTGRRYTLSGPLSKEGLTALRKRLPPAKQ